MKNYYYFTTGASNASNVNPTDTTITKMNRRIKTNIKFVRRPGEDNLVGFVTKRDGSWMGCREDDPVKKKVVILDYRIAPSIQSNVLYQCSLMQMRNNDGFVAMSAKQVKFRAKITTSTANGEYLVKVAFGHKTFIYNPASCLKSQNDIQRIAALIRERVDLVDAPAVAEEFINSACLCRNMHMSQRVFKAC